METTHILAEIDAEIARLQQARAILNGSTAKHVSIKGIARSTPKKRHMSAEARAKIAAAQKARWAKARKAAK